MHAARVPTALRPRGTVSFRRSGSSRPCRKKFLKAKGSDGFLYQFYSNFPLTSRRFREREEREWKIERAELMRQRRVEEQQERLKRQAEEKRDMERQLMKELNAELSDMEESGTSSRVFRSRCGDPAMVSTVTFTVSEEDEVVAEAEFVAALPPRTSRGAAGARM